MMPKPEAVCTVFLRNYRPSSMFIECNASQRLGTRNKVLTVLRSSADWRYFQFNPDPWRYCRPDHTGERILQRSAVPLGALRMRRRGPRSCPSSAAEVGVARTPIVFQ